MNADSEFAVEGSAGFDSAVTNSLLTALSKGLCPELTKALGETIGGHIARTKSPTPGNQKSRSPSRTRDRNADRAHGSKGSKNRSRSRRDDRSRSRDPKESRSRSPNPSRATRKRSPRPTYRHRSRDRKEGKRPSRSRYPDKRSRHQRTRSRSSSSIQSRRSRSRSSIECSRRPHKPTGSQSLMHRYKKRSSDQIATKMKFKVNEYQLNFNEGMISDIHLVAQSLFKNPNEAFRILTRMKAKVIDRQENIVIADTSGTGAAEYVDGTELYPISKEKQKKVETYFKMQGGAQRSNTAQQPFRGQRGEQPRIYTQSRTYTPPRLSAPGPYATGNQGAGACYICHKHGHWADRCPTKFGPGAFVSQSARHSGAIKPLFNDKRV